VLVLILVVLVGLGALAAVDAAIRRAGGYLSARWRAGWRALPEADVGSPYRGGGRAWVLVARSGVPRATSVVALPVLGMALFWCFCSVLAMRDLLDVMRGTRSLPFVLASLTLCVARALTAFASAETALGRRTGAFFLTSALALGHDIALATLPVPCSDSRVEDVCFALAGVTVQTALLFGYVASLWMRRGLVETGDELVPPGGTGTHDAMPSRKNCTQRKSSSCSV
jgi:hypothetical protein